MKKISDFPPITSRNNDDWLLIEEAATGAYKSIKVSDFIAGLSGGSSGTTYDTDAQNVINAIQATGVTLTTVQKDACNARIVAMKNAGIWTKRLAYYGFLGGTAAAHAINWKSVGAYNITWNGTLTHSSNGVQADGSTGWGNTNIPLNLFNAQNTHLAIYHRSNAKFSAGNFISQNAQNQPFYCEFNAASATSLYRSARGANNSGNNADVRNTTGMVSGHLIATAVATPNIFLYKNGVDVSSSRLSGLPENYQFTSTNTIELFRYAGLSASYSSAQISSFAVGTGLTAAETLADYQAEQAYQQALGRNV